MEMTELIRHPELFDRETLYELRSTLALYPYYQPARLLMLHNLYLLHDSTFDEELRKAAIYVTDRRVIFQMIEAAHYQLNSQISQACQTIRGNRTEDLIDTFLESIPFDEEQAKAKRRPTPADAAVDYVAYLLANEEEQAPAQVTPLMKGQDLIDSFLEQEQGRIMLAELPKDATENIPEKENDNKSEETAEEEYFTETLARIYIKQGRYQKALDIIGRLNQQFPSKNAYFADQMRFLEKLIINSNNNKK